MRICVVIRVNLCPSKADFKSGRSRIHTDYWILTDQLRLGNLHSCLHAKL